MSYSVLMSVYKKENPLFLKTAIESMLNQIIKTDDFVIVWDGDLTSELEYLLEDYLHKFPDIFRFLKLDKNMGLGYALSQGVSFCKHSLIARMDSDDIAVSERIIWQLEIFGKEPHLVLCGGQIEEFISNPDTVDTIRKVPLTYNEIYTYAKKRNPMNHMTVMFRKEAVLAVGNYLPMDLAEDYYLWVRLLVNGYLVQNLPEVLVKARVGNGMFERRGGFNYARNMIQMLAAFYRIGFLNRRELISNIIVRSTVSLLPSKIRKLVYQKGLRR